MEEKRSEMSDILSSPELWLFLRAHVFGSLESDVDSLRCLNLLMKSSPMKGDWVNSAKDMVVVPSSESKKTANFM